MKKLIVILAVLVFSSGALAIEKPCKKPCDIVNADSLTVVGDTTLNNNLVINNDIDVGSETLQINSTMDDVSASQTGASKSTRFRGYLGGDGTKPKYTSMANTIMIRPTTSATLTMTDALYGVTVRPTDASNGVGTGTFVVPEYRGFTAGGLSGSAGHTYNIDDLYQIYIEDWVTQYGGAIAGTRNINAGLWIEPQTSGTVNYGIVIDGDVTGTDYGSAIVLGPNQEAQIFHSSAGNLSLISDGAVVLGPQFRSAPPATENIDAGGTITADACGTTKLISTDDEVPINTGAVPLTLCAGANSGCRMIIKNVDTADTITLLSAASTDIYTIGDIDIVLAPNGMVDLVCANGVWNQISAVVTLTE